MTTLRPQGTILIVALLAGTRYAIGRVSDDPLPKETIDAAVQFLVSTQGDDGAWLVPGTKKSARNKPTPTAGYWGTAWAVIGLLESS